MDNPIDELIKTLREGDWTAQEQAAQRLVQSGTEAVEPLIAALANGADSTSRQGVIFALARLHDPRIVPALLAAFEADSAVEARIYTAQALAVQKDARAIEPLIGALGDAELALREEAARALGEIGEVVNSPRIVEALDRALTDTDWGTRQSAAEMLIRLESAQWERAETLLLEDLAADDAEIRLGAAASLVELGDVKALEPLVELLYHADARFATHAALTLGKLGDQRAVLPLTATLNHQDEDVRKAARKALRHLGVGA